jgi:hypothetical protein
MDGGLSLVFSEKFVAVKVGDELKTGFYELRVSCSELAILANAL